MKQLLTLLLLLAATNIIQAQTITSTEDNRWLISEGRRLYTDGEYGPALNILNKVEKRSLTAGEAQELDLLRARATFGANHLEGRALLLQYLADYPETSYRDVIAALGAESYYYSHSFALAEEWFAKSDFERLEPQERERAGLYKALTLSECGREAQARTILAELAATGKKHADDAQFHLAVLQYHANELQQAYQGFKKVEFTDRYYLDTPYYIAAIYLKEGKYEQAGQMAEAFIADHGKKPQGIAMRQIAGAALFGQGKYTEAVTPLEEYIAATPAESRQRIATYQLALCYFETGQPAKAKELFLVCSDGDDAIAQNALLHLGIIDLGEGNSDAARLAFEQAANMTHDDKVREEALYNYALCLHSTRYSPFAESVKVFEQFLNEYPQSKHCDRVNKYLVEVYMNTRNYDVALQSINKITAPSPLILEAKQKVLYRLGVQEYIDGNMDKAISRFDQSIALSKYNKATHSDALYWRAEAYYNKNQLAKAAQGYRSVISMNDANSDKALYGLAYTQFQQGKYNEAINSFTRFTQLAPSEKELCADAYNRIADCHFYNRNYKKADEFYGKAASTEGGANSDYALYRSALSQGLRKEYDEKTATLEQLIKEYPASDYTRDAYYELGRAYIETGNNGKAVKAFDALAQKYPQSDIARRAIAEKAMIYNSDGNYAKAIETYKSIITLYPQSEEAQIAAQDLKNLYVEQGEVEEFAKFAAATKGMQPVESNEIDTLTFIAAEKIYGKGDRKVAKEKFADYLKKFPEGSFALDSHYYLGLINYNSGDRKEALAHLEAVSGYPDNKYSEEAMAYASEIHFDNGEWSKAAELYERIIAKSSDKERVNACRANLLRCTHNTGDNKRTSEVAATLLADGSLQPEQKRETEYYLAKAQLATGEKEAAEKTLRSLATDTRSIYGAEGKYLLAQLLFDSNRFNECEKEIFDYIDTSTPHSYWLARSFVLLADLYIAQERTLEAKQYLLSLQNNYDGDDDIETMIKERLGKIKNEE